MHDLQMFTEVIEQALSNLERCQSLEKVHRLYEAEDYSRVADVLLETFRQNRSQILEVVERHEQLLLLQDSLLKVGDMRRCLYWSEVSFHEAFKRCYSARTKAVKQEWMRTMVRLLAGIDK